MKPARANKKPQIITRSFTWRRCGFSKAGQQFQLVAAKAWTHHDSRNNSGREQSSTASAAEVSGFCHGSIASNAKGTREAGAPATERWKESERERERHIGHEDTSISRRNRSRPTSQQGLPLQGSPPSKPCSCWRLLTPQGNAAAEDRIRCGLAPKRRFAGDGCNALHVVVSPRANAAHGWRARPAR